MTVKANKNSSYQPRPPAQVYYMRAAERFNSGTETHDDIILALTHSTEITEWRARLKRNNKVNDLLTPSLKQRLLSRFNRENP